MRYQIFIIISLLILAAAGAALLGQAAAVAALPAPTPTPTLTPEPTATATAIATPTAQPLPTRVSPRPQRDSGSTGSRPGLLEQYLPEREIVAESEHFIFYASDGYFPVDLDWFVAEAETAYDYVSRRLDHRQVKNKIAFGFMPPDQRVCPVRGLASHNQSPVVLVYADVRSTPEYVLGVLAHELGHAIPSEGFPGGLPDDQALTEGLATWASGAYWDRYKQVGSLHDLVLAEIEAGRYQPLNEAVEFSAIYPWHEDAGPDCLEQRDRVYAQWGSFLGYLVETYGWAPAYDLFRAPRPQTQGDQVIEFPPDYEGVYGRSLNQLEHEWLLALPELAGRR